MTCARFSVEDGSRRRAARADSVPSRSIPFHSIPGRLRKRMRDALTSFGRWRARPWPTWPSLRPSLRRPSAFAAPPADDPSLLSAFEVGSYQRARMIDIHAFSRGLSITSPFFFFSLVSAVDPDLLDFGIRIASDHARSS